MFEYAGDTADAQPAIVVGDPFGFPAVTPSDRVDPNTPLSPFAGVVSLTATIPGLGTVACSEFALTDRHIITAAHCVDLIGGTTPGGAFTGDGIIDVAASDVTVIFNHDNPTNNFAGASTLTATNIVTHPDWHGFNNALAPEGPTVNDDLAIITLPVGAMPAAVPTYTTSTAPFIFAEPVILAGYGVSGDGVSGLTVANSLFVKRAGVNLASAFATDEESPFTDRELFFFDFDGPTGATDILGDGPGFGNDLEVTLGPGDSGGPAFIWDDLNSDFAITANELAAFGINTFSISVGPFVSPLFGSLGGGTLLSAHTQFIAVNTPEPTTLALWLCAAPALLLRRRR